MYRRTYSVSVYNRSVQLCTTVPCPYLRQDVDIAGTDVDIIFIQMM